MAYHELSIPHGTRPDDERFVRDRLEPFLRDVHAMLRLPIPRVLGLDADCSRTCTLTLLAVVGGVSKELYLDPGEQRRGKRKYKDDTARFKEVLIAHFPWSQEPRTGQEIVGERAADVLYRGYRCALAHNLGRIEYKDFGGIFKVGKGPLLEEEIEAIERSRERPSSWTNPTLQVIRGAGGQEERKLKVKCLYWGVRNMIEDVLATRAKLTVESITFTNPLYPSCDVTVSATPQVSFGPTGPAD